MERSWRCQKLEDMPMEAFTAAVAALSPLGFAGAFLKPFRAALVEQQAAEKQREDAAKMLEQVNSLKRHTAQRRDALKAEVDAFKEQLEAKTKVLEGLGHDVDRLQQQAHRMMAEAVGSNSAPKRAGSRPRG